MARTRYLWHLDANGWPLERIDTLTGEHVPVFTGGTEELAQAGAGRPMACCYPRTEGMVLDWPNAELAAGHCDSSFDGSSPKTLGSPRSQCPPQRDRVDRDGDCS